MNNENKFPRARALLFVVCIPVVQLWILDKNEAIIYSKRIIARINITKTICVDIGAYGRNSNYVDNAGSRRLL